MADKLMYIELKTGYNHNGPAWISKVKFSQTGKTVYFNGHAFKKLGGQGNLGNYYDLETNEEYWISGVKKDENNRLYGSAKVAVDKKILSDFLELIGKTNLDTSKYTQTEIQDTDISKFRQIENSPIDN
jgi:hypothetical protein